LFLGDVAKTSTLGVKGCKVAGFQCDFRAFVLAGFSVFSVQGFLWFLSGLFSKSLKAKMRPPAWAGRFKCFKRFLG
jgi:hypothetical protein